MNVGKLIFVTTFFPSSLTFVIKFSSIAKRPPHLSKIISYSSCSSVVNRDEEIYHYYVGEQLPIIGECKHIAGCVRGFTRVNYCVHAILPLPHSVLRKYISLLESFLALWWSFISLQFIVNTRRIESRSPLCNRSTHFLKILYINFVLLYEIEDFIGKKQIFNDSFNKPLLFLSEKGS